MYVRISEMRVSEISTGPLISLDICSFFKTLNPRNFQTNNSRKLPLVQMIKLLKRFSMMYHKCQKSSISKSLKTREKKKEKKSGPSTKSLPKILLGWNKKAARKPLCAAQYVPTLKFWRIKV